MNRTLINETIDDHGRAYRLWAEVRNIDHDLIDIHLTSTFTGSVKPNEHRTIWQTSLPREAIETLQHLLAASIDRERSHYGETA